MSLSFWRALTITCAALSLLGCGANHDSIYRHHPIEPDTASMTMIDAKQRVILAGKPQTMVTESSVRDRVSGLMTAKSNVVTEHQRFCAEPSPDVFTVVAQALSASGTFGKSADPASIQAALNAAFSSAEQGSSIPRTQTINMLRELMYRTCERYLSGGITSLELPLQAIRDQRLMVSILAIEQLTGAITPRPVVINAGSGASSGSAGDQAVLRIDNALKELQTSVVNVAAKQADYDKANLNADGTKDCEAIHKAIADKKEDSLSQALKDKKTLCTATATALKQANESQSQAQSHYAILTNASKNGGATSTTSAAPGQALAAGGVDRADVGQVSAVADAVTKIVASNFDQDEFLFLCLKVLAPLNADKGAPLINQIESTCLKYVTSKLDLETLKNNQEMTNIAEIIQEKQQIQVRSDRLFEQFWTAVAQGGKTANPAKINAIADRLNGTPKCFETGGTRARYQACFNSLRNPEKQALSTIR